MRIPDGKRDPVPAREAVAGAGVGVVRAGEPIHDDSVVGPMDDVEMNGVAGAVDGIGALAVAARVPALRDIGNDEEGRIAVIRRLRTEAATINDDALRVLGLDPYDIGDRVALNNHIGSLAQNRESYYVNCWHLYRQETLDMWEQYGHNGVAVCSRYGLLKSALDGLPDQAHAGLVRYGSDHLAGTFNALAFITTKQVQYAQEREVRAWITVGDPLGGGNRHFDLNNFPHPIPLDLNPRNSWVPDCKRRRIDLRSLITEVFISPWAEDWAIEEIRLWVQTKGFPDSARRSELTPNQTPRVPEPEVIERVAVTKEELERFCAELSGLTPDRVRFLYRQRWDVCRLNRDIRPRVTDIQYLEATLRVLDDLEASGK